MNKKMNKIIKKNRKLQGFTLIEMVIVIAIVVMLMIIIAPNLVSQKQHAQTKTDEAFATTLQTQVELYQEDHKKEKLTSLEPLRNSDYLTSDQKNKLDKYELRNGKVELRK